MKPVARFQLQVLRAFKAGQAKAQKMVRLYEGFLKNPNLDHRQKTSLKLAVAKHRSEVKMYKQLIASALNRR